MSEDLELAASTRPAAVTVQLSLLGVWQYSTRFALSLSLSLLERCMQEGVDKPLRGAEWVGVVGGLLLTRLVHTI